MKDLCTPASTKTTKSAAGFKHDQYIEGFSLRSGENRLCDWACGFLIFTEFQIRFPPSCFPSCVPFFILLLTLFLVSVSLSSCLCFHFLDYPNLPHLCVVISTPFCVFKLSVSFLLCQFVLYFCQSLSNYLFCLLCGVKLSLCFG